MIELRRYGARNFGRPAADRYVEQLRGVFRLLLDNPLAGVARDDVGPGIRVFVKRKHRIVYLVGEGEVTIVRVLHHSRDASRHLEP